MKEQGKNSQDQINKEDICKLHEKEFKIMIVKMTQNLKNRMEKMQGSINTFNKDLEVINRQKTHLLKLKILWKRSIAEYLRQKNR